MRLLGIVNTKGIDVANSILSSAVQENVAPLGLRSVGIVNTKSIDVANSILSSVVQENVAPLGLRSVGIVNINVGARFARPNKTVMSF